MASPGLLCVPHVTVTEVSCQPHGHWPSPLHCVHSPMGEKRRPPVHVRVQHHWASGCSRARSCPGPRRTAVPSPGSLRQNPPAKLLDPQKPHEVLLPVIVAFRAQGGSSHGKQETTDTNTASLTCRLNFIILGEMLLFKTSISLLCISTISADCRLGSTWRYESLRGDSIHEHTHAL